jgi:hypothetical protein
MDVTDSADGHSDEVLMRSLQLFEPEPEAMYTIEAAARLAQVPRRRILIYYKHGLVSPRGRSCARRLPV